MSQRTGHIMMIRSSWFRGSHRSTILGRLLLAPGLVPPIIWSLVALLTHCRADLLKVQIFAGFS